MAVFKKQQATCSEGEACWKRSTLFPHTKAKNSMLYVFSPLTCALCVRIYNLLYPFLNRTARAGLSSNMNSGLGIFWPSNHQAYGDTYRPEIIPTFGQKFYIVKIIPFVGHIDKQTCTLAIMCYLKITSGNKCFSVINSLNGNPCYDRWTWALTCSIYDSLASFKSV